MNKNWIKWGGSKFHSFLNLEKLEFVAVNKESLTIKWYFSSNTHNISQYSDIESLEKDLLMLPKMLGINAPHDSA